MSEVKNAYPGVKGRIELKQQSMIVDGDQIAIEVEDSPPDANGNNTIQIRLALAPDLTWWKMLQVVVVDYDDKRNVVGQHLYGQAELQDDKKGPALALDYHLAPGGRPPETFELRFWKAKLFGVHTDMEHWVMNGGPLLGKRVTFTWLID